MIKKMVTMVVALILITISLATYSKLYPKKLGYVMDTGSNINNNIFIISKNGKKNDVLRIDANGKCTGSIESKGMVNDYYLSLNYINGIDNDNAIVYEEQMDILKDEVYSENIYLYDFNNNTRTLLLNQVNDNDSNIICMNVYENNIYYAKIKEAGTNNASIEITCLPYKTDNGDIQVGESKKLKNIPYLSNYDIVSSYISPDGYFFVTNSKSEILCMPTFNKSENWVNINYSGNKISQFTGDEFGYIYYYDTAKNDWFISETNKYNKLSGLSFKEMYFVEMFYGNSSKCRFYSKNQLSFVTTDLTDNIAVNFEHNNLKLEISHKIISIKNSFKNAILLAIIILGFLVLLIWVIYILKEKKVSIVIKIIVSVTLVVSIGMIFLYFEVKNLYLAKSNENQTIRLASESSLKIYSLSKNYTIAMKINDFKYQPILYRRLKNDIYFPEIIKNNNTIDSVDNIKIPLSYFWLYTVDDGNINSAFCQNNYRNIPIKYIQNSKTIQSFNYVLLNKKSTKCTYTDEFGKWTMLISPIFDSSNKLVAILESGENEGIHTAAANTMALKVAEMSLFIGLSLIFVIGIFLRMILNRLELLSQDVAKFKQGNWSIQSTVMSNDEVGDIAQTFNTMAKNTNMILSELEILNQSYFRFVPSEMFKMLGHENALSVQCGESTVCNLSLMYVSVNNYENIIYSMNKEEIFDFSNYIFSIIIPKIKENNGIILQFDNDGLIVLFKGDSFYAFDTALKVSKKMRAVKNRTFKDIDISLTITIDYGQIILGIVGFDLSLAAVAVANELTLAKPYKEIALKYGCIILATEQSISEMTQSKGVILCRILGKFYLLNERKFITLYDVFESDDSQTIKLKLLTKELFEQGVYLFQIQKYVDAQHIFLNCLSKFYNDKAAQEYVYLCKKYIVDGNKGKCEIGYY